MIIFFCAFCFKDQQLHPVEMCNHCATAICPDCGNKLKESYARPENPTPDMLGLNGYNNYHGIDN